MARPRIVFQSAQSVLTLHRGLRGKARAVGLAASLLAVGCRGAGWNAPLEVIAPPGRVAEALGDPSGAAPGLEPAVMPAFGPPRNVRPCCAFGMDLTTTFQGATVPGYKMENVTSLGDLGHHEYDNGAISLRPNERFVDLEKNGLVYTCRGGFIDTAHVRDNSDMMLYVALRIAEKLTSGGAIEIAGDGAMRRIVLRPVPPEIMTERGRMGTATTLAQWAVYQISIWHEMATWYGWESVPGFSERVSTFSIEDLYSNTLGIKVGAAVIERQLPRSRDEYDLAVDAWIAGAARHLAAVPREAARAAMSAVDGLWWDSKKTLPDSRLVKRRNLDIRSPIEPWRVEDAVPRDRLPPSLTALCSQAGPPLPLVIPETLGSSRIADLVTVEIRPEKWAAEAGFPFPKAPFPAFTSADYPTIVESIRADMSRELGEGFDRPGPAK